MDKWNVWYKNLDVNKPDNFVNSDLTTFQKGYDFLKSCNKIEDWGCGSGGFKMFCPDNKYIGIDGSKTPFANIKADLTVYKSKVNGIFMRHILEHNYQWKSILENAIESFTEKMCLILFTPFSDVHKEIAHNLKHGIDVPDLSFSKSDLLAIFSKHNVDCVIESLSTNTQYQVEHILYLSKKKLAYYSIFCGSDNNCANMIPPVPSSKYDCYFFTNNKNTFEKLKHTNWIPKFIDIKPTDDLIESCMLGKILKTMPHKEPSLMEYNYLCFMDSKLNFVSDNVVLNIINTTILNDTCIVFRKHGYIQGSVWNEYTESINYQERYRIQSDKYKSYIELQVKNGLSDNCEQFHLACGFIIRDMTNPKTHEIGETWYDHIQICGIEDQISFYFVKQLFQKYIGNCPWNLSNTVY